jgi:hypothetical protein
MAKYITLLTGRQTLVDTTQTSAGVGDADKIVSLNSSGKLDSTLFPATIGEDIELIITSEAISAGALINIYDNAGTRTVRNANSGSTLREAHGFVLSGFASGVIATVYLSSINTQVSGLTPGARLYLSTTAGAITQTPPTITSGNMIQFVGFAASSTSFNFEYDSPIYIN